MHPQSGSDPVERITFLVGFQDCLDDGRRLPSDSGRNQVGREFSGRAGRGGRRG